jgi:hypothetical protein
MTTQDSGSRFTFYFPVARVLSNAEVADLPAEKKQAAESTGKRGIWLEIDCPDQSCVNSDGNVTIPAARTEAAEKKGVWLNVFCPNDSCEMNENTALP